MRIFISFTIAFLFTILAAGRSSAQMMDHSCHEAKKASGAMKMAKCNCSQVSQFLGADSGSGTLTKADCCLPEACRDSLVPKKVVLGSTVTLVGFSGMVRKLSFFQPMPLAISGSYHTGLPPPLLHSTPAYIQHCSFLI